MVIDDVRRGDTQLYLIGYTDYIDRFGGRHRVGYARVYNPGEDARAKGEAFTSKLRDEATGPTEHNNLPFVMQPGYNYDRPRVKGEGNDWEETI